MRKREAKKRPLLPDPKFKEQLVTRFVNNLMWDFKAKTNVMDVGWKKVYSL